RPRTHGRAMLGSPHKRFALQGGSGFPKNLYPTYPRSAVFKRRRDQKFVFCRSIARGRYRLQRTPCFSVSCFRPAPFHSACRKKSYTEERVRWYTIAPARNAI